jgi:hypothetical protein
MKIIEASEDHVVIESKVTLSLDGAPIEVVATEVWFSRDNILDMFRAMNRASVKVACDKIEARSK